MASTFLLLCGAIAVALSSAQQAVVTSSTLVLPNGAGQVTIDSVDADRPADFAFTQLQFLDQAKLVFNGRYYATPLGGVSFTASNVGTKEITFRLKFQPTDASFCQLPNVVLKRLAGGGVTQVTAAKFITAGSTCYFSYPIKDQLNGDRNKAVGLIGDMVFLAIPPTATTRAPSTPLPPPPPPPTTTPPTTTPPTTTTAPANGDRFEVTFTYVGAAPSATFQNTVNQAGQFLSSIITAGLPDFNGVDDLTIAINITTIDGPSNVLGMAGPRNLRPGSRLPYTGFAWIDVADQNSAQLLSVLNHEFLHVLGFGTLWGTSPFNNLITASTPNNLYVGVNALVQYRTLFSVPTVLGVPLENSGGSGTANAHWEEDVFQNELMTGFLNFGSNPISTVTLGALQDLGYSVNYNAATYVRPSSSLQPGGKESLGGKILAISDQIVIG